MSDPPLPEPGAAHRKMWSERGRHTLRTLDVVQHPATSPVMTPRLAGAASLQGRTRAWPVTP
jgi:hypothetical protein